jgi:hypothetical protein
MQVVIENPETGETKTLEKQPNGQYPVVQLPWRVKGTVTTLAQAEVLEQRKASMAMQLKSRVAVYAAKAGIPMAEFLDTARWLLDKDCPYCQTGTLVLRRIQELGEDIAVQLLNRIQEAKARQDNTELSRIRHEISSTLNGR